MSSSSAPASRLDDLKVSADSRLISLAKLVGSPIVDIHGRISREFGEPVFQATEVVFADGTGLSFEGEHDIAYLVGSYSRTSAAAAEPDALRVLLRGERG